MSANTLSGKIPDTALHAVRQCRFAQPEAIIDLPFRDAPYWAHLLRCRHLGVHRPDARTCNWTARILTRDKRYVQKCLGPALDVGRGRVPFLLAVERAFDWFLDAETRSLASTPKPLGRTTEIGICPIGETYTVGHALKDYSDWTRLARSPGGHYNNLVLINYHLVPIFAHVALEDFNAEHLVSLAQRILETPSRFGFAPYRKSVSVAELSIDEIRKRKRTFNSLVSIMRMAFEHAWDGDHISSDRPIRCLKRISVNHAPRTIFLNREECRKLLEASTPALRNLILAALYTGCRVGELSALRVEDIGRHGYGIYVDAFKRGRPRFVFLPDEGMAFFLSLIRDKADHEPVLLSDMGKIWRRQHTSLFRRAVSKASLPRTFVFHGLRHTYASELIRAGVPIEVVAKQLGHANSITVSNTYGHLAEHYREDQIRRRFSPVSQDYSRMADQRKVELQELWRSFQATPWRDYAAIFRTGTTPLQSFGRAGKGVLEVFREAEGQVVLCAHR